MNKTTLKLAWLWCMSWIFLSLSVWALSHSNWGIHLLDHALAQNLRPPTLAHPLGFDAFGRDVAFLVFKSAGLSMGVAAACIAVSFCLSLGAGSTLALLPEKARFLGLRALDLLLAFPPLLPSLAFAAIKGPSWDTLIFSILIGSVPHQSRLVYVRASEVLHEDYVTASRSQGASRYHLAITHTIPAALSLLLLKAPVAFAHALMAEATVTFLGVGAPLGQDTWGSLLAQGKEYLIEAPHIAFGAGLPLALTVFSIQWLTEKRSKKFLTT